MDSKIYSQFILHSEKPSEVDETDHRSQIRDKSYNISTIAWEALGTFFFQTPLGPERSETGCAKRLNY